MDPKAEIRYPVSAVTGLVVLTALLVLAADALLNMAGGACTMAFVLVVWIGGPLLVLWATIAAIEVLVRRRRGTQHTEGEHDEASRRA